MDKRQVFGLLGAALLFLGAFAPIVSVPFLGNQNYFQNGRGDGVVMVLLAAISMFLCLVGHFRWLWLTGGAALGMLAFTFGNFQMRLSQARREMDEQLAGNPFSGLAEAAIQSVQIQWGFAVLLLGALLLLASAAATSSQPRSV